LSKVKSLFTIGWFYTKKLYLLITVISLILGLKIATLYIKPNLTSKSFINQAFDNYSVFKNSANIAPINARAITTTNKEIVDIFPLNKITVKAEQKIADIAEAQNLKVETIVVNNNLEGKNIIPKDLKELIVPWQDGYVFFPKNEILPKELADKYKMDEKVIYEANEDKLNEQGKFKKDSTIILPTKDFTEIKKILAKEKQLLQLEEQYKQVKDNQSKLAKSYQDQFSDPTSGGYKYATSTSEDKVAAGLIWPTKGSISRCIQPGHPGCDIANPSMPPVYAVADGVVSDVYHFTVYGYGNAVVIDHGNGLTSLSAHLNETYVTKGQTVSQGQAIGQMGNTGNSTGTHLHIEIKQNKVVQNPLAYFP
jgi:murein DD-endopeptidase MepM/ murein hydrolase activator NlpD